MFFRLNHTLQRTLRHQEVDYGQLKESVRRFNHIAQHKGTNLLNKQVAIVQEEVNEVINAMRCKDYVEILDGVCDVIYTCLRLEELIELAVIECQPTEQALALHRVAYSLCAPVIAASPEAVAEGFKRVCLNNDTKISKDPIEGGTKRVYLGTNYWVKLNENGKVMKPWGFTPVDLTDLAQQHTPQWSFL